MGVHFFVEMLKSFAIFHDDVKNTFGVQNLKCKINHFYIRVFKRVERKKRIAQSGLEYFVGFKQKRILGAVFQKSC